MDERFVLADDRTAVLEHYVPGSEEAYFHTCLVHQQKGDLAKVPPLVEQWIERHGHTSGVQEVLRRAGGHTVWLVTEPGYRTFGRACTQVGQGLAARAANRAKIISSDRHFAEPQEVFRFTGRR